ncbi:GMC family oxidoreductase [soil metagenome]
MAFIDARSLPAGSQITANIVIIGGGLAGITLAKQWAKTSLSVAVLESGGRDFDPKVQALYGGGGVVKGPGNPDKPFDDYLTTSRRRMLGGSGNVWGGKVGPLDEADFAARSWIKHSGWPVDRKLLAPFYDRACDLLEVPRLIPAGADPSQPGRPALNIAGAKDIYSTPRAFTRYSGGADKAAFDRFRTEFAQAPNITVYLNANVVDIALVPRGGEVAHLDVACLDGPRHTAKARAYVLATGGIENARLLLASNKVAKAGVGNGHDLVGRYFMGHVTYANGSTKTQRGTSVAIVDGGRSMSLYADNGRDKLHCVLSTTLPAQRAMRTANFTVTLSGFGPPVTDASATAIQQVAQGVAGAAKPGKAYDCFMMAEHLPNPDSRITLAEARDALGMQRVKLEWQYSDQDWHSLEQSADRLADELGAAGVGRLCWPAKWGELISISNASRHHMGTTRMATTAAKGVVDPDGKVFGVDNLYIAGSSVFPTSGIMNPTLTLMALAMRQSDHLARTLGASA